MDWHIDELMRRLGSIDGLEQHRALVLVEELGRLVDMVVVPGIWPTYDHDGQAARGGVVGVVDTVVVDGGLQQVFVLLQPVSVLVLDLYHYT